MTSESSEEVVLGSEDAMEGDDLVSAPSEELDAGVHEQAAEDSRLEQGSSEEEEPAAPAPGSAVAAIAQETAAAAARPREPEQAAQQPQPAGLGAGGGGGAPKGLGGLGLRPPSARSGGGGGEQQQPEPQQPAEPQQPGAPQPQQAAAPRGLGGGLGLGSRLPARPGGGAGAPNGTPGAGEAAAAAPAKPAGGLGLLPPKRKAAGPEESGAGAPQAAEQQQQQEQQQPEQPAGAAPAKPAGGVGGLPAKQPAGGLTPLGPRPAAAAGGAAGSSAAAGGGGAAAQGPPRPAAPAGGSAFRPVLPGRPAAAGAGGAPSAAVVRSGAAPGAVVAGAGGAAAVAGGVVGVVDPEEPKSLKKLRQQVQDLRVGLLRAAMRLGLAGTNEQLGQYLGVLDRLEKVQAPMARRRADVNRLALATATELNETTPPDSPVGFDLRIMVVGMTGTGKSELINALLDRPALSTNAFRPATRRVRVVKGRVAGVTITAIDTPGLTASSDAQASNRSIFKSIKAAYKRRKPHFVLYVDRLDAPRPGFGEMSLLTSLTAALGPKVWKQTMVVLTHANAARDKLGKEYGSLSKQRRNILQNILRQAAGEMQLRTPFHLVDTHPEGPRAGSGQAVVFDQVGLMSLSAVPWRQNLLVMLLGLYAYETAQALLAARAAKGKAGAGAGAKQQDLFKQMMRSRLPPTSYFVEQLVEGVAKPDGWGVPEDPYGQETDDEEAEEFKHIYYKILLAAARRGDARAQREYAAWLRRLARAKRAYREAYDNEEVESLAAYGYEGYVAEGLDLGPTFDPEDATDHRYQYVLGESPVSIMPTLDYYGYEHEDAITGFVAEYSAQPFNVRGWGGVPLDVTATVEKDKTTTCLQAEASASLVHSVAPFGNRHITQVAGAFELLRPNVKDVLYTLEVNTFKDGMLRPNDHAGAGLMLTRMAEGGNIRKGPVGVGVRMQETMRLGALKVEAVAAQVRGETPMGGRDEGWGARAFLVHDWLPGLGASIDWYQERTKDDAATIGGWATALLYDCGLPGGYPASVELDWVSGGDIVHVDASIFSSNDWKPAWLLLLPAVNLARDWISRWRARRRGGEPEVLEEELEEDEGEEGGMAGADLGAMLQGMSGPDAQAMLQQLMQSGGLQQLMGGRMG